MRGLKQIIRFGTILAIMVAGACADASAQRYPERSRIREGNREFARGNFEAGETDYLRALDVDPQSYEARFNLANSLYRQERYEEAAERFKELAEENRDPRNTANSRFNMGNSLFQQEKYEEALAEYKNALLIDPSDMEAKFNYAYTKKLLEKDEDQDEQEDEGDGESDKDQNGEGDDQNEGDGDPDGGNDPQEGDRQNEDQQPQPQGLSREEAEQMLNAVQQAEDNTRDRIDAQQAAAARKTLGNGNRYADGHNKIC